MHTTIRADDIANLAYLQSIRGRFEGLLHLAVAEPAQISALVMRGAVGVLPRKFAEFICRRSDLSLVATKDLDGLLFRARNIVL
jgi:hypothetical protein